MNEMEIIRVKKPEAEFYSNADEADKRYRSLMEEGKEVYLDPILNGRLWVITVEKNYGI
jgi:hypothetical protein